MNGEEHPREPGSAREFAVCAKLLPDIRQKYTSNFDLLEIPEVLRVDESMGPHGTIFFRKYDGQTYNDKWSEQTGGSDLGTDLSSEMARLIQDFRKIDISWVLQHPVGKEAGEVSFNLQDWLKSFRERATGLDLLEDELGRAEELFSEDFESAERVISNGDFYPRNLIKVEQKFVLIDWGYWSGSRACFIDYLPNVAAFAYVHMWNNERWRGEFATHVSTLGVKREDLRKAIVIKAFEQAAYWKGHPTLWPPQVSLFRKALQNTLD